MFLSTSFGNKSYGSLLIALLAILSASCNTGKRVAYFKNVPDSLKTPMMVAHTQFVEPTIKPHDILSISIQTINPGTTGASTISSSNTQGGGNGNSDDNSSMGGNATSITGYMVDEDGYIDLPLVGRVKVGGMTTKQARQVLFEKASTYYKDPIVNVGFANFTVTMLGDVNRPGRYTIPNEEVSILDAIGMAGDLTISGKRDNIMLIREDNGKKEFVRLDLNSTNIFKSPYFYLRQGDIVYVQPNKAKAKSGTADRSNDRIFTYSVSLLTLFIAILARFPNL